MNMLEKYAIEKNGEKYYVTIGLEIHAEMNTQTKMWCGCKNDSSEKAPNTNICPVCMAHPGTLPVPNAAAIINVIKVGAAVNATIADFTEFDRKNYFYPDIPKGYQISQYKYPIVSGGSLAGVDITRVHLEEDTAKSTHDQSDATLVDFNRAGVPLMELVTEPCIHDAATAVKFAKELQLLLRYLNVSHANMEMGEMRVEVNLSVSKNKDVFGTKVEVKNINSFKAVEKSINTEIERHIKCIETGDKIVQETRGYDENTGTTFSQRAKENSEEYRYFPDPDITKFFLHSDSRFDPVKIKASLPELPSGRRTRYEALNLKPDYIELFISQNIFGDYFDEIILILKSRIYPKEREFIFINLISNYICSDIVSIVKNLNLEDSEKIEKLLPSPKYILELVEMLNMEKIASRGAKELLVFLFENKKGDSEKDVNQVANDKNLMQITNEAELTPIIKTILQKETNQKSIADYKAGKEVALMALVGQVIKETSGRANPNITKNIFIELLK